MAQAGGERVYLKFDWLPTKRTCGCPEGRLNCLTREELAKISTTVINVNKRQRWSEEHPARFIPQVPEKYIKLFSHKGETVLDPFCGSGTTNVVAKQLGRNSIGIDVNPYSTEITKKRLKQTLIEEDAQTIHEIVTGDMRKVVKEIPEESIDLIVTSPPYFDVVDYHHDDPDQWGNIHEYDVFLERMREAFELLFDVLKKKGFMVVVTQDVYRRDVKCPIHADYIQICRNIGFTIYNTEIYILNYSKGGRLAYGYPKEYYPKNDHEFILIFRKP